MGPASAPPKRVALRAPQGGAEAGRTEHYLPPGWAESKHQSGPIGVDRSRERFLYEYDFYDQWVHELRLEKKLPLSAKRFYPVCVDGAHLSPPEDCGGARAYMERGDPRWWPWLDQWPRRNSRVPRGGFKTVLRSA